MSKRRSIKIVCVLMAAVLLLIGFIPGKAEAVTSGEVRQQIDELEEQEAELRQRMEALDAQIKENVSQMGDVVEQKEQIDQQISLLHDQIRNINDQIGAYAVLVADQQAELSEAEENLVVLQQKYKERIRAMEEQGSLSYWEILFEARNFSDLLDRINMIQEIVASDNRRLEELRAAKKRVEEASQILAQQKKQLELTRTERNTAQQLLSDKRLHADLLLRELLSRGEEYDRLMVESEQRQEELMQEIAEKENEYDRLAREEWLATSVPETTSPDPGTFEPPAGDGNWVTPVKQYVLTSPFGMRLDPVLHYWKMHNGVDMAWDEGTPIYAARSGIVSETGYQEQGAGNYVYINHGDGYRTVYMHMTHFIVSAGDRVFAGQLIGYMGSTGWSTGYHLHFGISYNGTYVNPMEYLP